MPTYEYKCNGCGATFERFQSITSEPTKKCPECGKNKARRLIGTGAGLIFKGSGFYITDYRDKSYTDKAKAESGGGGGGATDGAATSGEAKGDSKSDSKPAAETKKETKSSSSKGESKPAAKSDAKPSKKK